MGVDGKLRSVSEKKEHVNLVDFVGEGYILVADSGKVVQGSIRSMLRLFGMRHIEVVGTGKAALAFMMRNDNCRFVIMDIDLPGMSGIHVVRELRAIEKLAELNVLMIAREGDSDLVAQAAEFGANGYIIKPFVAKILEEKLVNIVHNKMDPPEHVKLILHGEKLLKEGKSQAAIDIYNSSKGLIDSARINTHLAEAYEKVNDNAKAHEHYEIAAEKNPNYLKARIATANLYMKEGNEIEALRSLEVAAEISPFNAERKTVMGKIYINNGEAGKAFKVFDEAVNLDKTKCNEVAELCLSSGNAERAEQYFRRSLGSARSELSPDEKNYYVHTYNRLGIALRKQGKWQEAIEEYKKALIVLPNNEDILFNMGRSFLEGGSRDEAKACLEAALKIDPDFKEAKLELEKL